MLDKRLPAALLMAMFVSHDLEDITFDRIVLGRVPLESNDADMLNNVVCRNQSCVCYAMI